ncbi:MAG TPA: hypothetical protein VNN25_12100 [Thermoanaerobaculia bacterium]|nr:hypothetical protein [Thermoanaerobaculia bacterium]
MPFYSSPENVLENPFSFRKRIVVALLSEVLAIAAIAAASFVLPIVLPSLSAHGLIVIRWIGGFAAIVILCFGIALAVGEN